MKAAILRSLSYPAGRNDAGGVYLMSARLLCTETGKLIKFLLLLLLGPPAHVGLCRLRSVLKETKMGGASRNGGWCRARVLSRAWVAAAIIGLLALTVQVPVAWSQGDSWTPLPAVSLEGRFAHTAVWTGSEMIVWGGCSPSGTLNDGARYNQTANGWASIQSSGAPSPRCDPRAGVWTGTEMIVWGGVFGSTDAARYNPVTDTWTPVPPAPIAGRAGHAAVWTGTEMIVWGGLEVVGGVAYWFDDGAKYNPTTNAWTVIQSGGAPSARSQHTAVWTGTEMIVWGARSVAPVSTTGRATTRALTLGRHCRPLLSLAGLTTQQSGPGAR